MVAYAVNQAGIREVIGFGVYPGESKETWKDFFLTLKNRGLSGVRMITADAHEGIQYAISEVFPDVPCQRCQVHFTRNILDKTPKKYREGLKTELREMFTSDTIELARNRRDEILQDYRDIAGKAMECLENGFESAMTVMIFSENTRKILRTSNHIERLNRELKRRSNVIGIFPNSESLLRLMGSVILERNDILKGTNRRIFYQPTYEEIIGNADKLQMIAMEQRQLMAA